MAGISPLASTELASASTPTSSPTLLHTGIGNFLVEVIITNPTGTDGEAYVYLINSNLIDNPLIVHKLPVPAYNSYQTTRFAIDTTDEIYVAGTMGLVFYAQGIFQT